MFSQSDGYFMVINSFIEEINSIRAQRSRNGEIKPHKFIMLLSVIDLIESGEIVDNKIYFSQSLVDQFDRYFNEISKGDDWCQPGPPFFHLRSSRFWHHKIKPGREDSYSRLSTSGGGIKRIVENIDYAYFDKDYYNLLCEKEYRAIIRRHILDHFFSNSERNRLSILISNYSDSITYENNLLSKTDDSSPLGAIEAVRDIAFRRVIVKIYDSQCAVCGFRIVYPTITSPIDAAHLIPWSKSKNDHPSNGIALCKLHHWALDARLISPTFDFKWKVSNILDSRRNSENQITIFSDLDILLPKESSYYPSTESIAWCLDNLLR